MTSALSLARVTPLAATSLAALVLASTHVACSDEDSSAPSIVPFQSVNQNEPAPSGTTESTNTPPTTSDPAAVENADNGGSQEGQTTSTPLTQGSSQSQTPPPGAASPSVQATSTESDLIDDFEDGDGVIAFGNGSGHWFTYGDGTGSLTPAEGNAATPTGGGAFGSQFAMHATGSGFTAWGGGLAVSLNAPVGATDSSTRQPVDLSAYSGVSFVVMGAGTLSVQIVTSDTATTDEGGRCEGTDCSDHYSVLIAQSADEWHQHELSFEHFRQAGWGAAKDFDVTQVLGLNFAARAGAGETVPSRLELTLDDVRLVRNASGQPSSTGVVSEAGGREGFVTRFWDCCKPHCAWSYAAASPMRTCDRQNASIANPNEGSACDGGASHVCYDLAPYAVTDTLSYGFAATPDQTDTCGVCYQLNFTGSSLYGVNRGFGDDQSVGPAHSAGLAGKTMIIQAINVGNDVSGNQFDILIPGGGVGQFNACSAQWGVSDEELGAQFGGFLTKCQLEFGYKASADTYTECVLEQCDAVFGSRGLTELAAGCSWFATWFGAADNPKMTYEEVDCPPELTNATGLAR